MKTKLLAFLFFMATHIFGQVYPVQVSVQMIPPYSLHLSEYQTSIQEKLFVNLLLTDINVSNRQVRLKMYIEGNGFQISSTDNVIGAQPVFLDGGINTRLSNIDLAPYFQLQNLQGISPQQYADALPDGQYNFCFEVYDYLSGQKISQKSCTSALLLLNDPPFLNTPSNGELVSAQNPTNIIFTWTPRHVNATNVVYEFTLKEIMDTLANPQTVFMSSPVLHQTTTPATTLLYGPGEPSLFEGHTYAWQVRASLGGGFGNTAIFRNDGYSEIYSFKYVGNCDPPTMPVAQLLNSENVKISWQPSNHLHYRIQYRKQGMGAQDWFVVNSYNTEATIHNLEAQTTYEYRVGGECIANAGFSYTTINTFTTPDEASSGYYNCGMAPDITISNHTPLPHIGTNEVFTAGDFPVTVTTISGSNGIFSGEGYVGVPFLHIGLKVKFTNIKINTDYQLYEGKVETDYDANWTNIADVDEVIDYVAGDSGQINNFDATNINIDSILVNTSATVNNVILVDESGTQHAITTGLPVVIHGANNETWVIDEDGHVSQYQTAEGGAATAQNTNGMSSGGQVSQITSETLITFDTDTPLAYYNTDKVLSNTSASFKNEYEKIPIAGGGDYDVVYKLICNNPKATDTISATANFSNGINKDSIIFKTADGISIPAVWQGNKAHLQLKKQFNFAKQQILATVKTGDSTGIQDIAGKLNLWHTKQDSISVTLVPVGNVSTSGLKAQINEIYNKAGIYVDVHIGDPLSIGTNVWDLDSSGQMDVTGSGLLANYTAEERAFIDYYRQNNQPEQKMYYIFLLENISASESDVQGFMPLKRKYGFVFNTAGLTGNELSRAIAHEFGHGAFGLKHPFKEYSFTKGATDLLMDYGNGTRFSHMDWQKMHADGIHFYGLQGDEEGMHYITPGFFNRFKFGMNADSTFTFLTPSAQRIVLPYNVRNVNKFFGYFGDSFLDDDDYFEKFISIVPGTLRAFDIIKQNNDTITYQAKIIKSNNGYELAGYYNSNDPNDEYIPIAENNNNKTNAIIFAFNEKGEYKILKLNGQDYNYYQSGTAIVSPNDFVFNNILESKTRPYANGQQPMSITQESLDWTFNNADYNVNDHTLLMRNKILELRLVYPELLKAFSKHYGKWHYASEFCYYDNWTLGEYESHNRDLFCDINTSNSGSNYSSTYYTVKNPLPPHPASYTEWHKNFYDFTINNLYTYRQTIAFTFYEIINNPDLIPQKSCKEIATAINASAKNDIYQLPADVTLKIISKLLNEGCTGENSNNFHLDYEHAIIKLIKYANPNEIENLLIGIEGHNVYDSSKFLAKQLFLKIQDGNFFFGNDNRKELIAAFTNLIYKNPTFYNNRIEQAINNIDDNTFIYEHSNLVKNLAISFLQNIEDINTFGLARLSNTFQHNDIKYEFVTINDTLKINLKQTIDAGWRTIKDPKPEGTNFKPFDLVFFLNRSNLSLVQGYLGELSKTSLPIPSIAVAYSTQAGTNQDVEDGIFLVIDVGSLIGSGGTLTAVSGLSKLRKIYLAADIISSLSSVAATGFSDDNQDAQELFNIIAGVSGLGAMAGDAHLSYLSRAKGIVEDASKFQKIENIRNIPVKILNLTDNQLRHVISYNEEIGQNLVILLSKQLTDGIIHEDDVTDIRRALTRVVDIIRDERLFGFIDNLPSSTWSDALKDILRADINNVNNAEFKNLLVATVNDSKRMELAEAWKIVRNAIPRSNTTRFALDPDVLKKVSEMMQDGSFFRTKYPNDWQLALDDILKCSDKNPCTTCGDVFWAGRTRLDKHLENIEYYLQNFNDNKFNHWIRGKTINGNNLGATFIDEMNMTLRVLKKNDITAAYFDRPYLLHNSSTNYRYDILNVNTRNYYELKNAVLNNALSQQYVGQMLDMLLNVESMDKAHWTVNFAKNKGRTFEIVINNTLYTKTADNIESFNDIIKLLWQKAFTEYDTQSFNAIWNNPNLRTSLFGPVNELDNTIKAQKKAIFDNWIATKDNKIFKFIKTE